MATLEMAAGEIDKQGINTDRVLVSQMCVHLFLQFAQS